MSWVFGHNETLDFKKQLLATTYECVLCLKNLLSCVLMLESLTKVKRWRTRHEVMSRVRCVGGLQRGLQSIKDINNMWMFDKKHNETIIFSAAFTWPICISGITAVYQEFQGHPDWTIDYGEVFVYCSLAIIIRLLCSLDLILSLSCLSLSVGCDPCHFNAKLRPYEPMDNTVSARRIKHCNTR